MLVIYIIVDILQNVRILIYHIYPFLQCVYKKRDILNQWKNAR